MEINNKLLEMGHDVLNYNRMKEAGRLFLTDILERTPKTVAEYIEQNDKRYNRKISKKLKPEVIEFMLKYADVFDNLYASFNKKFLRHQDWISANALWRTYMEHENENPFFLFLRLAVEMYHRKDLGAVLTCLNSLGSQYYTPATPTIFNAGFINGQMSSCFLFSVEDSIESIYNSIGNIMRISKNNGGIGMDISRLRHSEINGGGKSGGILPWINMINSTVRAVRQGMRRNGACTVFCRIHHIDVMDFCTCPLEFGESSANGGSIKNIHNIHFALWIPSLFWQRVSENGNWTLFCPHETEELNDICGEQWEEAYLTLENKPIPSKKVISAQKLLEHIVQSQQSAGMPYMLNADACNFKSNQRHLGYIRNSNLCLEILEYSDPKELPSCNLSSISLSHMVNKRGEFDYDLLSLVSRQVVNNINMVIDNNYYPMKKIKRSNDRHRPIGIGVSGFAEMVYKMDLSFVDNGGTRLHPELKNLNKKVFACMYFNSLGASVQLAIENGQHISFPGSPLSEGKLQFDLWRDEFNYLQSKGRIDTQVRSYQDDEPIDPSTWNQKPIILSNGEIIEPTWDSLRSAIQKHGVRNSLLIALMPTATSSLPLRNSETVEAPQENIYSRKLGTGAYSIINRFMRKDLKNIGLWNSAVVDIILADQGSINQLPNITIIRPELFPDFDFKNMPRLKYLVNKYRTMWELPNKIFLQMAADRGRYICQSQSTNAYMAEPGADKLIALHLYANKLGLKTGMYYLRQSVPKPAIKTTISPEIEQLILNCKKNNTFNSSPDLNCNGMTRLLNTKPNFICTDDICLSCQ